MFEVTSKEVSVVVETVAVVVLVEVVADLMKSRKFASLTTPSGLVRVVPMSTTTTVSVVMSTSAPHALESHEAYYCQGDSKSGNTAAGTGVVSAKPAVTSG